MVVQHNMSAVAADRYLGATEEDKARSAERLSTGFRINRSADDAAGLAISEKLRWQIRGLHRASDNIQDGISLLQVADGALSEVHDMLNRMRELAVQAANDTNTDEDRQALQKEIDQIRSEINRIGTDTEFNGIKLFKPTNAPEITGSPTDILVYHEYYNGGTREGGIIYNGKRYAYEDMSLDYDEYGNIQAGTYTVQVYAQDGEKISIDLFFDGGSRVPSGREYLLEPDQQGIWIDRILHPWSEIKNEAGAGLDPSNIQAGIYSFRHAGMTITFEVAAGLDLDSLIDSLKKDGLETYTLRSSDVTTTSPRVTPSVSFSTERVDAHNQDYIPGSTGSNNITNGYRMHADATGIYMYIDAAYSMTGKREILTQMTWEQLGLDEWMRYDPSRHWVNPNSTVTGGERASTYVYRDDITGIDVSFTIDSEVSQQELINAINSWQIRVTTNNHLSISTSTTGNVSISASSHSGALDAYGTQYQMGRTMSQEMVMASNQKLTLSGGGIILSA